MADGLGAGRSSGALARSSRAGPAPAPASPRHPAVQTVPAVFRHPAAGSDGLRGLQVAPDLYRPRRRHPRGDHRGRHPLFAGQQRRHPPRPRPARRGRQHQLHVAVRALSPPARQRRPHPPRPEPLRSLWPWLSRVEQRTGVPASIMMAIYGHETSYGAVTGNFDIIEALASLAYEGRRRPLFEREFVSALEAARHGHPPLASQRQLRGRHRLSPIHAFLRDPPAGGRGRRRPAPKSGRARSTALASIGNYLKDAGWKPGVPWGIAVSVPVEPRPQRRPQHRRPPRMPARPCPPQPAADHARMAGAGRDAATAARCRTASLATLIEPDGPRRDGLSADRQLQGDPQI